MKKVKNVEQKYIEKISPIELDDDDDTDYNKLSNIDYYILNDKDRFLIGYIQHMKKHHINIFKENGKIMD